MKNVKKSRALPRSRSKMTTSRLMPHITKRGASMRGRGSARGPKWRVEAESSSRFSAKYAARNRMMRILAISPGWKEKDPKVIQSLEPPRSVPTSMGRTSSATPAAPIVYL